MTIVENKNVVLLFGIIIALIEGMITPYVLATTDRHIVLHLLDCIVYTLVAWFWLRSDRKEPNCKISRTEETPN